MSNTSKADQIILGALGRGRGSSVFVKQSPNAAGPVVFSDFYFDAAAGGGTVHTLTVGGTVVFSGSGSIAKIRSQSASGTIVFSGTAVAQRVRVESVGGTVLFSGTAPITFTAVGGGTTYNLTVGGTVVFSGVSALSKVRVSSASGTLLFSGTLAQLHTRSQTISGSMLFSGNSPQVRTKIDSAGGVVVFNSSAPMSFIPGSAPAGATISRLNVKVSRSMGL